MHMIHEKHQHIYIIVPDDCNRLHTTFRRSAPKAEILPINAVRIGILHSGGQEFLEDSLDGEAGEMTVGLKRQVVSENRKKNESNHEANKD